MKTKDGRKNKSWIRGNVLKECGEKKNRNENENEGKLKDRRNKKKI